MPKALAPGQPYAHRRPDIIPFQVNMEREAFELLHFYAGPGRTISRLLSRLVFEHHARQEAREEERARHQQADQQALVAASTDAGS
jgi:hypothetical protein